MTDKPINHIVAAAKQAKEASSRDQTRRIRSELRRERQTEPGPGPAAPPQASA